MTPILRLVVPNPQLPQIKLIPPEGTYLLWLDCRELGLNDPAMQQFFIRQVRVGLSPGVLFGEGGSRVYADEYRDFTAGC